MTFLHFQIQWVILWPLMALSVLAIAATWLYPVIRTAVSKRKVAKKYAEYSWHSTMQYQVDEDYYILPAITTFFLGLFLLGSLAGMMPYQAKYYSVYENQGTVSEVHQQFTDGTGSLVSTYILNLDGSKQQYIVTDSRLTGVKKGDTVDMACTWQWNAGNGADQINCNLN